MLVYCTWLNDSADDGSDNNEEAGCELVRGYSLENKVIFHL